MNEPRSWMRNPLWVGFMVLQYPLANRRCRTTKFPTGAPPWRTL
jgi:hypothetical protein